LVAVIFTWSLVHVVLVEISNITLVDPAGTVTVAGTEKQAGALLRDLESATVRPPAGAPAASVTVAVTRLPAGT